MKSKNDLIEYVLNNPKDSAPYTKWLLDGCEEFAITYDGVIDESLLLKLIKKSIFNIDAMKFLNALVFYLEPAEITPTVFQSLLKTRISYRRSVLIGLAHCQLSVFQLDILNQVKIDDALVKLLKIYILNNDFTEYDLFHILKPWKNDPPKYVMDYLIDNYPGNEKVAFIIKMIESNGFMCQ